MAVTRAVVIHAVESLIAEFTACCNLLGEQLAKSTDSKNAEHVAFACKGFYMKIFSMGLSRLPLGLVYQSKPRLWTAPIQDKLLASAQGLGIGAFNILEDHTASFQSFGDIAVFIALVLERDSREGSARFLGTHMLPKVVGRPWKLATAIPLGVVLFGQSSTGNPDDVFIADKALVYLQYLSQHLATESLHMEDYQMDYDGYSMNELIQNSLQFMAGCHAPGLRSVAFAKFKTFLRVFDHTVILHIIAEIMTKSGQPILEVAALAILKEFVHEFWNRPHDSGRHQSPKPNTFASPVLTETLLKLLLDPKQSFYLDPVVPSRTVLNDRQTLLRSSDVVMHVLNLYLYLLIRDLPSRKLGLWDKSHLDATRRAFLDPLARHVERLAQEQENQHCQQHAEETDHDDGVDHACAADPTKSLLLNMMQSTLSRIEEITTTADQDEQE
ncbi:uncharacterized protein BJ171DRAFT_205159 [Polychytrium aggregatum]|uniref:uncharacterized protein n=1 Tax=Polychytrium aggregatum TaxID=110093 RepID=UPI0022FDDA7D|nr:uncharacterized protein BJ171DRAFT_205159 [Polychytrium aggregatum]KAI9199613.1 hypothetical protein BJ171DRAFT_205159 [Polychytrium aggregatum]